MTRFIAAVTLLFMIGMAEVYGMELNTVLKSRHRPW